MGERESPIRSVVWDNGKGRGGWKVAMAFSHPSLWNQRGKNPVKW